MAKGQQRKEVQVDISFAILFAQLPVLPRGRMFHSSTCRVLVFYYLQG